ncbi:hypothetical protein LSH36_337g04007 [Paralvinella palmiformis]|uniref:Uncharacterized protein n=1 Tax=Paralvinella palmiformis TaxID=53620 RepID=A0AAD9N045_9ANNE|nr:hypothetical protein LSH36_337g04007 [Paralvinella palmiformis]
MTVGEGVPYYLLQEIRNIFLPSKNPDFRINRGKFHQC